MFGDYVKGTCLGLFLGRNGVEGSGSQTFFLMTGRRLWEFDCLEMHGSKKPNRGKLSSKTRRK